MVYSSHMQSGVGAQLVAFDSFLGGFPNIDEMSVDEVFAKLEDPEMGEIDLARFVGWKVYIPCDEMMMALEGDHPLHALIGFMKRCIELGYPGRSLNTYFAYESVMIAIRYGKMMWFNIAWGIYQSDEIMRHADFLSESARLNRVDMIERILATITDRGELQFMCKRTCEIAAKYGQIETVRYLAHERPHTSNLGDASTKVISAAARNGHVTVVKYLIENGDTPSKDKPSWINRMLSETARNGHLNVIKYFFEENTSYYQFSVEDAVRIATAAIPLGYGHVVRYILSEKPEPRPTTTECITSLLHSAIVVKSLVIVRYLYENWNTSPAFDDEHQKVFLGIAVARSSPEIVEYLLVIPD